MARVGVINIDLVARTGKLLKPLKDAQGKLTSFGNTVGKTVTRNVMGLTKAIAAAGAAAVGLGGALGTAGLLGISVKLAARAEQTNVAFTTFLKSGDKAKKLVADLRKFSDVTPFEPEEILEAGKQLLAFGFSADNITETLRVMGDAAAGSQKPIADFVDIMGKVKASGVASMGDVNRLADRGVPIFQALAKQMGIAESEVKKLVGTGKVGFPDMWAVMESVTSETGLFGGAMKNLSTTLGGLVSTLKGKVTAILEGIGTAIVEGLNFKQLTEEITELAEAYKDDIINATINAVKLFRKGMEAAKKAPNWLEERQASLDLVQLLMMPARALLSEELGGVRLFQQPEVVGLHPDAGRWFPDVGLRQTNERPPGGHGSPLLQTLFPGRVGGLSQAISGGIAGVGDMARDVTGAPAQRRLLSGLDKVISRAFGMLPTLQEEKQFTPYAGNAGALERGSQAAMSAILGTQERTIEQKQLSEAQRHRRRLRRWANWSKRKARFSLLISM
jgi:tape measure domain-containing protein